MDNNLLQQNFQGNQSTNSQFVGFELRLQKLESENKKLKDLFNSLFGGSNETRLYLKRQIAIDKQAVIGFYGKDPVKQQTTSITGATYVANAGIDTATFDGYTIGKVVAALRTLGLIT